MICLIYFPQEVQEQTLGKAGTKTIIQ